MSKGNSSPTSPRGRPGHGQADLFGHDLGASTAQGAAFASPTRRAPGGIRVGTSGYSFADWVGPFYPPGTRSGEMLGFYQHHFNTVEINATYYRIPPPRTMASMAERTPDDFAFMVKLPGPMTHKRDRDLGAVTAFRDALSPLVEAGKCAGLLAQFPYSFKHNPQNEDHLRWLTDVLPGTSMFAEFRHASWDLPDLDQRLDDLGLGFCAVDEPALAGLFPRRALQVGDTAYFRFHGRNARDWWSGGAQRYDYLYAEAELEQWTELVRNIAEQAKQTFIFFNNCHAGHAVINARMMEEMMGIE